MSPYANRPAELAQTCSLTQPMAIRSQSDNTYSQRRWAWKAEGKCGVELDVVGFDTPTSRVGVATAKDVIEIAATSLALSLGRPRGVCIQTTPTIFYAS